VNLSLKALMTEPTVELDENTLVRIADVVAFPSVPLSTQLPYPDRQPVCPLHVVQVAALDGALDPLVCRRQDELQECAARMAEPALQPSQY
jgi:hypothetical protein